MTVESFVRMEIPPAGNGQRVDHLLVALVPDLGLRGRRRLCEAGRVLLDGRPAGAAAKGRAGQELALIPVAAGEGAGAEEARGASADVTDTARFVGQGAGLAALYKPAGLHTARLAGGGGPNLEAALTTLLRKETAGSAALFPKLLNRLDAGTSGLVLAAVNAAGERLWREAEADGAVDKRYLAVVVGHPPQNFIVRAALDTASRARVRILRREAGALRHTEVWVIARFSRAAAPALERYAARYAGDKSNSPVMPQGQEELALVGCRIRKGARHQIRAHLAAAGCPLWGDALYGTPGAMFFLHHGVCRLPGFQVACPPVWNTCLPPEASARARAWIAPENE